MFKQHELLWRNTKLVHEAPPGSTITRVDGVPNAFLVAGPTHAPYWVDFDGIVTPVAVDASGFDLPDAQRDDAASLPGAT